ncbi:MAG TPA: hypothetical protein VFZ55_01820 [Nitrososphaera sp.]
MHPSINVAELAALVVFSRYTEKLNDANFDPEIIDRTLEGSEAISYQKDRARNYYIRLYQMDYMMDDY